MKKYIWHFSFVIAIVIVFVSCVFQNASITLSVASVLGVMYSMLVARNYKLAPLFGIVNVTLYGFILLSQNMYGGFIYNVLYSLPMLIYGLYKWNKASKNEDSGIKYVDTKTKIAVSILTFMIIIIYSIVLKNFNGNYVVLDSITSVLGYLGIFLLSNKYNEQWLVWIISNFANVILWTLLTITSINNLPLLIMWLVYLINSFYGFYSWNQKLR